MSAIPLLLSNLVFHAIFGYFIQSMYCGITPNEQVLGLEYLYNGTNGLYWAWRNSSAGAIWNFAGNPNPCMHNWQGVKCTADCSVTTTCNILEISLVAYNMSGSLPSQISLLEYLETFNIGYNDTITFDFLTGQADELTSFESVMLNRNQVRGHLPVSIGLLTNLQVLDLSCNNFRESIPASLSSLIKLTDLTLFFNHFTGGIPLFLNNLTALQRLNLENNLLRGTIPSNILSNSLQLEVLNLNVCRLSGTVPTSIGLLTSLSLLAIAGNALN
jgi:Leucine-rich repeat (LRR) protein